MKMLQNVGRFAALEVFITESVLRCVTGDGLESDNEPDATYAWIGAGIGLFLAICFVASMLYMMKKHMLDTCSNLEDDMRRPSIRTVDMKFEYKGSLSEDTC